MTRLMGVRRGGLVGAALLLGAGCSQLFGLDAPDRIADAGLGDSSADTMALVVAGYRRPIRIVLDVASGALEDFPMLVLIEDDPALQMHASPSGAEIHFRSETDELLQYEIARWDPMLGRLEAWVLVPKLQSPTTIYLHYGDESVTVPSSSAEVFAEYAAVWHLDDEPVAGTIRDATGNAPGTLNSFSADDRVEGPLGYAYSFSGSQSISFTNPLSGSVPHTISAWVDQRSVSGVDMVIAMGDTSVNHARFLHSAGLGGVMGGFYTNDQASGENIVNDGWTLIHWMFSGATREGRIYVNGALVSTTTFGAGIDTTGSAGTIGNASSSYGTNPGLNGTLDEVRISRAAYSAQRIAAEFANQRSPATFYELGAEEEL